MTQGEMDKDIVLDFIEQNQALFLTQLGNLEFFTGLLRYAHAVAPVLRRLPRGGLTRVDPFSAMQSAWGTVSALHRAHGLFVACRDASRAWAWLHSPSPTYFIALRPDTFRYVQRVLHMIDPSIELSDPSAAWEAYRRYVKAVTHLLVRTGAVEADEDSPCDTGPWPVYEPLLDVYVGGRDGLALRFTLGQHGLSATGAVVKRNISGRFTEIQRGVDPGFDELYDSLAALTGYVDQTDTELLTALQETTRPLQDIR